MNGDDRWGEPPAATVETPPSLPVVKPTEPAEVVAAREEPRPRVDLDQVHQLLWSVVGAVFLLVGTVGAAVKWGGLYGYLLMLGVGGLIVAYQLKKSAERRAAREAHERSRRSQERSGGMSAPY